MRKIHLALLALIFLSTTGFAAKEFRKLASTGDKVDFSLSAPDSQVLREKDASDFYELLISDQKNYASTDKKNLEEFLLLQKNLVSRGFEALEEPLKGSIFTGAKHLSFYRKEDQHVPAMNGEEAFTGMHLEFFYTQVFLDKKAKLTASTPVPKARLHGSIFLHCAPKSKATCPVSAITFHDGAIQWDLLPSGRGANSSAGGANQK